MSTSLTDPRAIVSLHLGRMDYDRAWALQRRVQQRLIDAKLSTPPALLPNVLLTVEHPPVFTIGKSGDATHLLASQTELSNQGATFVETDRGGDITFHGPGQLVGYPILDLDHFFADIGRYLRTLESVIIRTCESYGINAGRVAKRTGVWVDSGSPEERKICAMGIRCSRWVTMHGFALNMNTELEFYDSIIPCGISDREVTSIARELGQSVDEDECRERVVGFFGESFGTTITKADSLEKLFERLSNAET